MGQQQLLLIVLGVIIVGIAVVVGINVFTASSLTANNDALIADLQTIGAMAQQYYRKPTAMGGGGNSFPATDGFEVPPRLKQTANMSAEVTVTRVSADSITITGTGNEVNSSGDDLQVVLGVGKNSMSVESTNVND